MVHYKVPEESVALLGFRSKLEMIVNHQLVSSGVTFSYEGPLNTIKFTKPKTKHSYLADFLLSNGIIIEAKGLFTIEDRKKHRYIQEQHPALDIRFIFSNSRSKLNKRSRTTYAAWCDKFNFKYAHRVIPQAWFDEVRPKEELDLIISTLKGMKA